jgi:hypothetical protein
MQYVDKQFVNTLHLLVQFIIFVFNGRKEKGNNGNPKDGK